MPEKIKKHGKIILALGLILTLVVMYEIIPLAKADNNLPNREMKISDSRTSQTGVIYDWEADHSTNTVKCVKFEFCTTAGGTCTAPTGMDASGGAKDSGNWNGWTAGSWTGDFATGVVRYYFTTGEAGGNNYSMSTSGVTNSSSAPNPYYVRVTTYNPGSCSDAGTCCTGTAVDTGVTAFYILDGVAVSATVPETFSITVSAVASGSCTGDTGTVTVKSTSSASAVDFETLTANEFNAACHDIEVQTNAGGGYSLTSQETTSLKYSSSYIDDTVCGASACDETTAQAWTDADNYPGFGHSCENVTGTPCNAAYDWSGTKKYRQFACVGADADCNPGTGAETAIALMSGSAGTTKGKIHYKVGITGTEAAGVYTNSVVYIGTPTY